MAQNSNTFKVAERGSRLQRPRWDRLYWHLRCLRHELVSILPKYLGDHGNTMSLVDFGCAEMPYRSLIEPFVDSYRGADLPGNQLAELEINEHGRIEAVEDSSVDVVLSSQVLEHVTSPTVYLDEARRILRGNGLLILSTHGVWRYHPDPTDYWRWTSAGLTKVITDAGFEITCFRGVMGPLATGLQLMQDAVFPALPGFVRPFWALPCQIAMQFADWLTSDKLRSTDASVFVVVAKQANSHTGMQGDAS